MHEERQKRTEEIQEKNRKVWKFKLELQRIEKGNKINGKIQEFLVEIGNITQSAGAV